MSGLLAVLVWLRLLGDAAREGRDRRIGAQGIPGEAALPGFGFSCW